MKKKASKKKPVKKLKPTAHKLGHHPDLRTKAGRAWKAKQAEKALREKAAAREQRRLEAAASVTGSWVDLKAHRVEKLKALATAYGMGADRLQRLIEEDRAEDVRSLVAAVDTPPRKVITNVPTNMEKLKASGMYWELFPNGHEKPRLITDVVGTSGGKATVAYWRVGV